MELTEQAKLTLFKALVLPILTYGLAALTLSATDAKYIARKWNKLSKRLYDDMRKPDIPIEQRNETEGLTARAASRLGAEIIRKVGGHDQLGRIGGWERRERCNRSLQE